MNKLKILLSLFSIFVFSLVIGYSLVFAIPLANNTKDSISSYTNNVFKDNLELSTNKIVLNTQDNPESFSISGDCSLNGKYLKSEGNNHIFEIKILDKDCKKNKVEISFKNNQKIFNYTLNLITDYNLYSKYLDYSTKDLEENLLGIKEKIKEFGNGNLVDERKIRAFKELEFFEKFFENILKNRNQKYLIPVKGLKLPKRETKVPNSRRPYRNSYTDGIHHGWDFDAKMRTEVLAIDEGIIIRVVNNFKNENFLKIKRTGKITEKDKLTNLDILRGNQVWLKTMKGDVVFYSHLDKISDNIKTGEIVSKGQILGNIGVTGVPEEGYSDYHLHMAIHKNPQITENAGKYTFIDIMGWPWYFKGNKPSYVLEHQKEVFDEN